jgi:hypothetical protein
MSDQKKIIESLNLILDKKIVDEIITNKLYSEKLNKNINYFILSNSLYPNEKNYDLRKLSELNDQNIELIKILSKIYTSKRWAFFYIIDYFKNLILYFPDKIIININNILFNFKYLFIKESIDTEYIPIIKYLFEKMNIQSDPKTFLVYLNVILLDTFEKLNFYSKLKSLKLLLDNNKNNKNITNLSELNNNNQYFIKSNNILFITGLFPSCLHGGGLRVLNFIKELSKNNNVYLFSFIDDNPDAKSLEIIDNHCKYYILKKYNINENYKVTINEIIKKYNIKIIHYEWIHSIDYYEERKDILQIFTYMEAVSLRLLLELKKLKPLTYLWIEKLIELINCLTIELIHTKNFDSKIAVTRKDAEFFFNLYPNSNYYVLNHGFNLQEFMVEDKNPEKNSIIFVGNFKHTPNIEAINFFYFNIWLNLKILLPDIKFFIVGANSDLLEKEILEDNNIVITGQVDDVKPYIQNAMVGIAPLISGAGLRGKVIEYAALKRTFVASSIAMEDLDFKNGEDFYLAEEPHEYIKFIMELLNDNIKRNNFSSSVYNKVIDKYDTKKLITSLEYFYVQNNA